MKIIGIDPGYERLGIAVIEGERGKEKLLHSECFKTDPKLPFEERLSLLGKKVERIICEYKPNILAIENLFLEKNQKTAMRVSEVRGAIIYIGKVNNLRIAEFTPLQVKQAVSGFGRGDKKQIEQMLKFLIRLPDRKMIDDELDAIAIALTGSARERA